MKKYKIAIAFCLLPFSYIFSQEVIKGKVVSANQKPLSGVTVSVSETGASTTTNSKGEFQLNDLVKGNTLIFNYPDYSTQEIVVDERNIFNIVLASEKVKSIEEVIVTGYTKQKKSDITGAVSVVEMKDLNKQSEPNPIKSLQGRVAGVNITADGSPSGSNTKVLIRGVGTLNNTDPLYVIDGVPTKSGMQELNPGDIESMQVLKDASSASIYGSRAANGVIIITTKKGKKGKMRIDLNYYTSFSQYARKTPVLDAQQFGRVLWQANINDGLNPNSNNLSYNFDWNVQNGIPTLNSVNIPEYLDPAKTIKSANTNWFDAVSQTGQANALDFSMSSASDKGASFFSLGYYDNDGVVKLTDFKRLTARVNTSYNFFDGKLKIGENFTYTKTNEVMDPGVLDPALRALPIIPVHTVDGIGWGGPVGGMNDRQNPVRLLEYNKDNAQKYQRFFGNAYAELKVVKDLTLRSSFGIDFSNYYKRALQRSYVSGFLQNQKNAVNIDESTTQKWTWSNTAQYTAKAGNHHFDLLGGMEMYNDQFDNTWLRKEGFLVENPDYMYPDAGTGDAFNGGTSTVYSLLSYFGKFSYDYDNRYLFSATLRYDGSSRFGKNNRFGTFPAFSLGWRINKEKFAQDLIPFFSDLRVRAGWGQTGNQEISNQAVYSLYIANYAGGNPTWATSYGTAYDISGVGSGLLPSGFIATQTKNDDLRWETTTQTNLGLDFGFFNQKLTGSVDVYQKRTKDILVLPPYLGVIGEGGNRWINGASMENKGLEVALSYQNETSGGFRYEVAGNFSINRNKITELPQAVVNNYGGNGTTDNILGRPINSMYGYVADGLFRTQSEVDNSAAQSGKGLGRIRYADLNGDGIINDKDRTWIGNPNPGFMYGLNINFSYKNFDLSTFWQGITDIDVINAKKYQTDFWSVDDVGSNKGTRLLNAWSPQNPNSDIPALTTIDSNAESRFSTYYVENGSYLKLRVLQLGYTLPKSILDNYNMSNFRIYASVQNLLTIKSKSFTGIDPESPAFGYPLPITINFGVNFSL
ncbi:TonB-dependent receptor [Elizabethkingia meningoseptica]|uniref:SusC/RagA family TonB-linked outer membrane protein n=1 Tax=Elizabethkingia meningoseptica TaxID=238 RepID=UPI0022F1C0EB|nr:TonB-dependent receptor [Elizabethkingia meningoseptica]EJK5328179.1 TonB-dependent receptor [Elizabethkingia meningoseptica]MCT3897452.1 TonB-dependent receptor [Elizabethkingia anophelis]MCT4122367.1 TonB-dependent receptor [Elizabethkingia anophelis]WBS74058.1 TonB-dependent receptor [Elizabethkingia meningoseptica]